MRALFSDATLRTQPSATANLDSQKQQNSQARPLVHNHYSDEDLAHDDLVSNCQSYVDTLGTELDALNFKCLTLEASIDLHEAIIKEILTDIAGLQADTVTLAGYSTMNLHQQLDLARLIREIEAIEDKEQNLNSQLMIIEKSFLNIPDFSSMQTSIDTIGNSLAPLVTEVTVDAANISTLSTFTTDLSGNLPSS